MQEVEKIVIIGPESTGKSTLCKLLSEHYKTICCPEYAREYLLEHGTDYTYEDLLKIAKGQLALEDNYTNKIVKNRETNDKSSSSPLLFADTNMYVMKVWCEYVFGKCHSYILDNIVDRKYSLYLLCDVDVPWVEDELREYPDLETRKELYHIYKDLLINQTVRWTNISGNYEERFQSAIRFIDSTLFI